MRLPTTRPIARANVRHRDEVAERQPADLADRRRLRDGADAEHDRAEDDRRDHHLDQRDEAVADRLESTAKSGASQCERSRPRRRGRAMVECVDAMRLPCRQDAERRRSGRFVLGGTDTPSRGATRGGGLVFTTFTGRLRGRAPVREDGSSRNGARRQLSGTPSVEHRRATLRAAAAVRRGRGGGRCRLELDLGASRPRGGRGPRSPPPSRCRSPGTRSCPPAGDTADPSERLEPYALDLMRRTHTDFITIMAPDRTRWTHPDRSELAGRSAVRSSRRSTAGPSPRPPPGRSAPVRAVTPITDDDGRIVGLVAARVHRGEHLECPRAATHVGRPARPGGGRGVRVVLVVAQQYLGRVTAGRGPEELARVFASYEGVLHSVHEGLVVVDRRARRPAQRPCGGAAAPAGPNARPNARSVPLAALDVPDALRTLLASGDRAVDETYATSDRVLVVNQEMAFPRGATRPVGTTHEFANRLHTVVALMELVGSTRRSGSPHTRSTGTASRAARRDRPAQRDRRVRRERPVRRPGAHRAEVLDALLAAKRAQAGERGVDLVADTSGLLGPVPAAPADVVTVLGNLVDNAVDAVAAGGTVRLVVRDDGPGIADVDAVYERGWSTKQSGPEGRGIGLDLVRATLARIGGDVAVTTGPDGSTFTVEITTGRVPS
ncbi:hypothetical protein Pfo_031638 [Paulownia fortunei]|nr:hypothetical protein Pfo_031638 [Paulownia fortunei]